MVFFRQKMKNLFDLPKEEAMIEIAIGHAPKKVSMFRIDSEHCNPYELWQEAGCPKDLNKKEVKDLLSKSEMIEEEAEYSYENGSVRINAALGVNDVYFFRIYK